MDGAHWHSQVQSSASATQLLWGASHRREGTTVEVSQGLGAATNRDVCAACRRADRKEAVKCLQLFLLSAKAKRLLPSHS